MDNVSIEKNNIDIKMDNINIEKNNIDIKMDNINIEKNNIDINIENDVKNEIIKNIIYTKNIKSISLIQPKKDGDNGQFICGPGIGPSGMQPRPNELRKCMPKITRSIEDMVLKAKRFAMEQSASFVLFKQVERHIEVNPAVQVSQTQRSRIINLMCRIYITGLNPDIRDDTVRIAFSPFGAIRRVEMSFETASQNKGFAFVEYEVPDSSELALDQMNNTTISGRAIKVTRPSNSATTSAMIDNILDEARPYPRIFVANIHPELHAKDLRSLFETFGRIRSCIILGERNPKHKGMAYIEYDDHSSSNEAIISMNLFQVGGQQLRVGKAITTASNLPQDKGLPPAAALAMAAVTAKLQGKSKIPSNLQQSSYNKSSKDSSFLHNPPIDNLINAIISPAMVQAGLSDLAADLVTQNDIKSIIDPNSTVKIKSDPHKRKRFSKTVTSTNDKKEVEKDEKSKSDTIEEENKGEVIKNENKGEVIKKENKDEEIKKVNKDEVNELKVNIEENDVKKELSLSKVSPSRSSPRSYSRKRRSRSRHRDDHYSRRDKNREKYSSKSHRHRSRSKSSRKSSKYERRDRHKHRHDKSRSKSPKQSENTLEDVSIKGNNARLLVMQKLARNLDSDVILMRNLVTPDEVDNELKVELEQECSKYGTIKQVHMKIQQLL